MRSASAAFSNPVQHGAALQIDRCTFYGEASREWNALPKWDAAVSRSDSARSHGPVRGSRPAAGGRGAVVVEAHGPGAVRATPRPRGTAPVSKCRTRLPPCGSLSAEHRAEHKVL